MNTLLHVLTNHQKHAPIEVDEVACLNRGQTTADYLELGHRFARAFAERGVGPGDRVLIATPTSPQLLGAIFGAWFLQAAVVLVPYEIKRRRKEQSVEKLVGILRDSQPAACLAGGAVAAILVEHGLPVRKIVDGLNGLASSPAGSYSLPKPEDVALIQYTSGSTASARGVRIRHSHLLANLVALEERMGSAASKVVSWLPLFHDMGIIGGLLFPLYRNAPLRLLATEKFMGEPLTWLRAIHEFEGTISPAPSFAYRMAAQRMKVAPERMTVASWRYGNIGAEPVFWDDLERFRQALGPFGLHQHTPQPNYGLAEATLIVSGGYPGTEPHVLWLDAEALRQTGQVCEMLARSVGAVPFVSNGPLVQGIELKICGPSGEIRQPGHEGEILIRGGMVTDGYFGTDPAPPEAWLDTGDRGFLWKDELYITGRTKDILIRGGANYHPQELERSALRVEGVRECAAFSVIQHEAAQERILIVVESRLRGLEERERLGQAVQVEVARGAGVQVDGVVLVPPGALPRTSSGKIQRSAAKTMYLQNTLASVSEGPRP